MMNLGNIVCTAGRGTFSVVVYDNNGVVIERFDSTNEELLTKYRYKKVWAIDFKESTVTVYTD